MTTLTKEHSEIKMVSTSGHRPRELAKEILTFLEEENATRDPVAIVRAWRSARLALAVLVEHKYPLQPFLRVVDEMLAIAAQAARRELIARVIKGQVDDARTEEIVAALAMGNEADAIADIDAVEKKLCA